MSVKETIAFLADEQFFFAIIDALDNLTDGCRRRMSPEDELIYSYMFIFNELTFMVTSDDSGAVGRSLAWLSDNSSRVIEQLLLNPVVSPWCSLPERSRWMAAFFATVLTRFATPVEIKSSRMQPDSD